MSAEAETTNRNLQRFGRVLMLKEGKIDEYERYHAKVDPGVLKATSASGIRNYSIFRYERWLFSYFELPAGKKLEDVSRELMGNPDCMRWEALMHELQEPLPQSGEGNYWVLMKEVWHQLP
jgi:L-rhamnose mutarotase